MPNGPIILDPNETCAVLAELEYAVKSGMTVRVWDDEGSFKVKVGFGSWTPPYGVVDPNARVE